MLGLSSAHAHTACPYRVELKFLACSVRSFTVSIQIYFSMFGVFRPEDTSRFFGIIIQDIVRFFTFRRYRVECGACNYQFLHSTQSSGGLIFDGTTLFRDETYFFFSRELRNPHHFTLSYCPWRIAPVNYLGHEIFQAGWTLLSKLRLRLAQWPNFLPIFQLVLNQSP